MHELNFKLFFNPQFHRPEMNPAHNPRMMPESPDSDLMARAAWLSFVGDLSQKQIAERLGISRIKANRLIARAIERKLVRFSVESVPVECVALEDRLMRAFGLSSCFVAPTVADLSDRDLPLASLAAAGAFVLQREFADARRKTIGVGHGRTLEATVEALPHKAHKHLRFVSLLGCLSRVGAADPLDVVHHLCKITAAECYYLPAPLFAASKNDKRMLMQQKLTRKVVQMGMAADAYVIGIGDMGRQSYLFNKVTAAERASLLGKGAVGDILGCFIDRDGREVECGINQRAVTVGLPPLRGKPVLAIAGGIAKQAAITAALRSGVVTDLVTDENTAARIMKSAGASMPAPASMRA